MTIPRPQPRSRAATIWRRTAAVLFLLVILMLAIGIDQSGKHHTSGAPSAPHTISQPA